MTELAFTLNGRACSARTGLSLMAAASEAGVYIPHLCHHPDLPPVGNCRLCAVEVDGRITMACTTPVASGMRVVTDSATLTRWRRTLIELLFAGGLHCCPGCERSGNCQLQALAYDLGMTGSDFTSASRRHPVDASHPDILLDRDRCILCGLCVRASEAEGKGVFAFGGRGDQTTLIVRSTSGCLKESTLHRHDLAANICPVGALMVRGEGFHIPIGERLYDQAPIHRVGNRRPRYPREES